MSLPDFLIIGVQRGGTSSLHFTLATHPQFFPAPRHKEVHFFDNLYHKGIAWYASRFPVNTGGKVLFESTPSYLYRMAVPARIQNDLSSETRFIVMLRNPTLRAWSQWWHYRDLYGGMGKVLMNPKSEPVLRGIYIDQFERWFRYFPRERFFIMTSEQFFTAPLGMAEAVIRWLGLKQSRKTRAVRFDPLEHRKKRFGKYKPPSNRIASWLDEFYSPYNKELEELLGEKFYW